jgi:hypothetical protein
MAQKKSDRDAQTLKNFMGNVKYYCEYNHLAVPDAAYIERQWRAGVPLDDLVNQFVKSSDLKQTRAENDRRKSHG